jgi:5-bromo-4-chloroindolyl phosphate hydrolysis protein
MQLSKTMKTKHIIGITGAIAATAAIFFYFLSRKQSGQDRMVAGEGAQKGAKKIRKVMHHAKEELRPGSTAMG